VTQTRDEKAQAIASVLWLIEDHHRMIAMGRTTGRAQWISALDGEESPPATPNLCHLGETSKDGTVLDCGVCTQTERGGCQDEAWYVRQRKMSAAYNLWAVSLSLQRLWREHPGWAQALESLYVNLPPKVAPTRCLWLDAARVDDMAKQGLAWMAENVHGNVPEYQPAPVKETRRRTSDPERDEKIRALAFGNRGWGKRRIAKHLGCSEVTVTAVLRGKDVRHGRILGADSP
jgi:hypothetical protein